MADATLQHDTVQHGVPGAYEAPLFGAYSKKVGMWLFLASDSLTFGALLFAFSYNRLYTIPWPTPFHAESIANATIMTACLLSSSLTMVMAVFAAQRGDRAWTRNWLLATMVFGTAFIVLHGMEWSKLIGEGLTIPGFAKPATAAAGELADISKNVPQFPATFFVLTAMHMMHVTATHDDSKGQYFWVCGALLVLTGVEVVLGYKQIFQPVRMLEALLIPSIIKSALIIGYFMHLKFEKALMRWLLVFSVTACF